MKIIEGILFSEIIKNKIINTINLTVFIKFNYYIKIFFIILHILVYINKYNNSLKINNITVNVNYEKIINNLNLSFNNRTTNRIKLAIYEDSLKNGGRERSTSLLLNYLNKSKLFDLHLFTLQKSQDNEYKISKNINRKIIKTSKLKDLIRMIKKKKINILIYQFTNFKAIRILNKIKNFKIIFYIHQCSFYWINRNYLDFKLIYESYQDSKYVISLLPFESDFLFRKWGIRAILMDNFITYEYYSVISSNLSSKVILMIGRGDDTYKRFNLGVQSMEYHNFYNINFNKFY